MLTDLQVDQAIAQGYGMKGCLYLLTPSAADLAAMQATLASAPAYGNSREFCGPDERLISEHCAHGSLQQSQRLHPNPQNPSRGWTHVHEMWGCRSWNPKELIGGASPKVLHFVSQKPWTTTGSGDSQWWPDLDIWLDAANDLLAHKPHLRSAFLVCPDAHAFHSRLRPGDQAARSPDHQGADSLQHERVAASTSMSERPYDRDEGMAERTPSTEEGHSQPAKWSRRTGEGPYVKPISGKVHAQSAPIRPSDASWSVKHSREELLAPDVVADRLGQLHVSQGVGSGAAAQATPWRSRSVAARQQQREAG